MLYIPSVHSLPCLFCVLQCSWTHSLAPLLVSQCIWLNCNAVDIQSPLYWSTTCCCLESAVLGRLESCAAGIVNTSICHMLAYCSATCLCLPETQLVLPPKKLPPFGLTDLRRHKFAINTHCGVQVTKHIIGQSIFQLGVMYSLVFYGDQLFNVPSASSIHGPSQHYTIVFNAFVLMQLFNQVRCHTSRNGLDCTH